MRPDALEWAVQALFESNGAEPQRARVRKLVLRAVAPAAAHPDGLARAMALRTPGECVFCEGPVTGLRVTCASADCLQAYQRAYHRDMRSARGQPARSARQ